MSELSVGMRRHASRTLLLPQRLIARRLEGKTRGQALIYVSLMMMTLIAFGALVADSGLLFVNRRQMQNAVDAAALAGAQNLPMGPNDPLGARPVACNYATVQNGVPEMTVDCGNQGPSGSEPCNANPNVDILVCQTYVANDSVRVTAHKSFDPLFGIGLGFATIEIRTQAIAVVGSVRSACVGPFYQTQDLLQASGVWGGSGVALNQPTIMKTSSGDANSGNFLALQLDGASSASDFRYQIGNPGRCNVENPPQTSGTATTNTGNMVGPFDQGMEDRKAAWVAQGNCLSASATNYLRSDGKLWKYPLGTPDNVELTTRSCYRMLVIPLLAGTSTDYNGTEIATIRGFLTFYVSNWCGQRSTPAKGSGSNSTTCAPPAENPSLGQLGNGELWGYYVGFIAAGGEDFQAYDGFGSKIVALIG